MKRAILFVLATVFVCGTAYGAAVDISGRWEKVTHYKVIPFTDGPPYSVPTATGYFDLVIEPDGDVFMTQDDPLNEDQYDNVGYPPGNPRYMITPSGSPGSYTGTSPGELVFSPGATTGTFISGPRAGTEGYIVPINLSEIQFNWDESANADYIYGGITRTLVDVSDVLGFTFPIWVTTDRVWHATRIPIPAAFWLLASGLAGMIAFRGRFRK